MKLLNVRLNGFIGIDKGLGLEEINLDLSSLSGLIALEGDNGMGKTTLLENLQPFRSLPSRKSALKRHCYLKNSQKELSFAFNGSVYRTLIKMDPTTTMGDEGFIWKDGESVVDGKVTNFDKYLVELLGSSNLFFNSIFCAQNSAKLSDMRPAELKALFAEFLRLDRYVNWEETAKAAARIYDQAMAHATASKERLDVQAKMLGDPRGDLVNATKIHDRINLEIGEVVAKIASDTEALAGLKKILLASHINQEKKIALERERDRLQAQSDELVKNQDNIITDLNAKSSAIEDELRQVEIVIEDKDKIREAVQMVEAADKIVDKAETDIETAEDNYKEADRLFKREMNLIANKTAEGELYRQDPSIQEKTILMLQAKDALEYVHKAQDEINESAVLVKLMTKIHALEESAAVLDHIDPACTSEVCGLITKSLDDKKALPAARLEYDERRAEITLDLADKRHTFDREILKLDETIKDLTDQQSRAVAKIEADLKDMRAHSDIIEKSCLEYLAEIDNLKATRKSWLSKREMIKPVADKAPEILVAESFMSTLTKQLDAINLESEKAAKKYADSGKIFAREFLANQEAIEAADKLIDPGAEADYGLTETAVSDNTIRKQELAADIAKYGEVIEACLKEIKTLERLEAGISEIDRKFGDYQKQKSEWVYIALACSKDGLRALEIEGVAPVITGYANDMLTGTFGPNHSVRFETQDEDNREVLDIIVIGEGGSETLLSNLSGGERVWILKALRLAQTLISQQKSGRHFQTALMDEEDGALSNENAMKFISLYGTLMKMAEMDSCFFISHRPDAINMADHQIKFTKGRISIT